MEVIHKDVLENVYREHRAVAHFNFRTLEDIELFIEAASELNTPYYETFEFKYCIKKIHLVELSENALKG